MTDIHTPPDLNNIRKFVFKLLQGLEPQAFEWVSKACNDLVNEFKERKFFMSFVGASRFTGKHLLNPDENLLLEANALRDGLNPSNWKADQAARILLLTTMPAEESIQLRLLQTLLSTAEMEEQVAIYSSFSVLPFPESLTSLTTEGIRTNMTNVFDAIALDNPYAAGYLSEGEWNQMYLKSAFMDRPIYRIWGVEARANESLARIISDFAHERWAAGRVVSPEFWRPTARFLNDVLLSDITRLLADSNELQQWAGVLVCKSSSNPQTQQKTEAFKEIVDAINQQEITWEVLGKKWWESKN